MKLQHKTNQARLRALLAAALVWALPTALAAPAFRAPALEPQRLGEPAPAAKAGAESAPPRGALRVGDVRSLPKAASIARWEPVAGGYVARLLAQSTGAQGMRVRLDLGTVPGSMELRVQGSDPARVESMVLDPTLGTEAWTPWTQGPVQLIEVFSPVEPSAGAVSVLSLLHFTASPLAKAAAACTVSTACTTGEPALDAQIAERKKSLARINFISGGGGFVCSATLVDTPRRPAPYMATANHCVENQAVAATVSAFWFYEATSCDNLVANPAFVQTAGGAQLVFGSFATDASLVLLNTSAPAGTVLAPMNTARTPDGSQVVSLSHPTGDTSRWATGAVEGLTRAGGFSYDFYAVDFDRGIIQGGSSGSGMFTRTNGRLELAGILSLGPIDDACTNPDKFGLYARLEVFHPQFAPYVGVASPATDDAPNRVDEAFTAISLAPLDTLAQPLTFTRAIDYPGDLDVFRFTLATQATVTVYTEGGQDVVASLLDATGLGLETNDDAQTADTNAGITRTLGPGAYFLQVGHWNPGGTGPYSVVMRTDAVDPVNHTALWWNASESGWGINVNHQDNVVFATLFTYNLDGSPVWLVMPRGERQLDGSYSGELYRTSGPPFNASPWQPIGSAVVGQMRLAFAGTGSATLDYTFDGRTVTKQVTKQAFKELPECTWSFFDRSYEFNLTDLWWNPVESGWGVNLTQQDETLFATLFTYAANGTPMWYVMPDGAPSGTGFRGQLYRTTGPAFDAAPWTATTPTVVGNLSVAVSDGNNATLTYSVDGVSVSKVIRRQVFGTMKTKCRQP